MPTLKERYGTAPVKQGQTLKERYGSPLNGGQAGAERGQVPPVPRDVLPRFGPFVNPFYVASKIGDIAAPLLGEIEKTKKGIPQPIDPTRKPTFDEEMRADEYGQLDPLTKVATWGQRAALGGIGGMLGMVTQGPDMLLNPAKYQKTQGEAIDETASGLVDMVVNVPDQLAYLSNQAGFAPGIAEALGLVGRVLNVGRTAAGMSDEAQQAQAVSSLYSNPESLPFGIGIGKGLVGKTLGLAPKELGVAESARASGVNAVEGAKLPTLKERYGALNERVKAISPIDPMTVKRIGETPDETVTNFLEANGRKVNEPLPPVEPPGGRVLLEPEKVGEVTPAPKQIPATQYSMKPVRAGEASTVEAKAPSSLEESINYWRERNWTPGSKIGKPDGYYRYGTGAKGEQKWIRVSDEEVAALDRTTKSVFDYQAAQASTAKPVQVAPEAGTKPVPGSKPSRQRGGGKKVTPAKPRNSIGGKGEKGVAPKTYEEVKSEFKRESDALDQELADTKARLSSEKAKLLRSRVTNKQQRLRDIALEYDEAVQSNSMKSNDLRKRYQAQIEQTEGYRAEEARSKEAATQRRAETEAAQRRASESLDQSHREAIEKAGGFDKVRADIEAKIRKYEGILKRTEEHNRAKAEGVLRGLRDDLDRVNELSPPPAPAATPKEAVADSWAPKEPGVAPTKTTKGMAVINRHPSGTGFAISTGKEKNGANTWMSGGRGAFGGGSIASFPTIEAAAEAAQKAYDPKRWAIKIGDNVAPEMPKLRKKSTVKHETIERVASPITDTPAEAVAEIVEGKRESNLGTKQFKKQMIGLLDTAIEKAPNRPKGFDIEIRKPGDWRGNKDYDEWSIKERHTDLAKKHKIGTVRIHIPDDGFFTIENTKEALTAVRDRVRNLKENAKTKMEASYERSYSWSQGAKPESLEEGLKSGTVEFVPKKATPKPQGGGAGVSPGTFMRGDAEKSRAMRQDAEISRGYQFKHEVNDAVIDRESGKKYMVADRYIQNGEARYTVYPPGKKKSLGYHVWVRESDLAPRKKPSTPTTLGFFGTPDAYAELGRSMKAAQKATSKQIDAIGRGLDAAGVKEAAKELVKGEKALPLQVAQPTEQKPKGTKPPKPPKVKPTAEDMPDRDLVGFSKAEQDRLLDMMNREEIPDHVKRAHIKVLNKAKEANLDANAVGLAEEIKITQRPLTDLERAGIELKAVKLVDEYDASTKLIADLIDKGDTKAAEIEVARREHLASQMETLAEGARIGTREAARAVSIAQIFLRRESYDLANVVQRYKAAKGSKITAEEHAQLEKLTGEHEALKKRLEEAEKKNDKLLAERERQIAEAVAKRHSAYERIKGQKQGRQAAIQKERAEIKAQLKAIGFRVNDITGITAEGSYLIGRLALNYAKEGVVNLDALVKRVIADVPGITERDVWRALNEKDPSRVNKQRSQTSKEIAQMKTQARLLEELAKAEQGIFDAASKRRGPTPLEIKSLQKRLHELRVQAYKSTMDAVRLERAVRTLTDLQNQLNGYVKAAKKQKAIDPPELAEIKAKIRDIRETMKVRDEIADLEQQMKTGQFKEKPERVRKPMSPELERARIELKRKEQEIRQMIADAQPMTARRRFGAGVDFARTMQTTGDFSGALRQNLVQSFSHPIKAGKSFGRAVQAAFSKYKSDQIDMSIQDSPYYTHAMSAGLKHLDPVTHVLGAREEVFRSRLAEKIPGLGHIVRASNRHMTTMGNLIRMSLFEDFMKKNPNATRAELEAYSSFLNVSTGIGDLGRAAVVGDYLSTLLFSPKLAVSRFQTPYYQFKYWKMPRVRKQIARDMAGFVGTGVAVLTLADLSGIAEVETFDPRDPDWGKIRIGNTRFDIWGGFQQPARLIARVGLGLTDRAGWTGKHLPESEKNVDLAELAWSFAQYKTAPAVNLARTLYSGENAVGQPTPAWEAGVRAVVPLLLQDAHEAFKQSGVGMGVAAGLGAGIGLGVSSYEDSETRTRLKIRKLFSEGKSTEAYRLRDEWDRAHPDNKIESIAGTPIKKRKSGRGGSGRGGSGRGSGGR